MERPKINLMDRDRPRYFANCDSPGCYSIATRVGETILNPGDTLKFEQFVTGYGDARDAKIQCYISSNVFDNANAHVLMGLGSDAPGEKMKWGFERNNVTDDGFRINPNMFIYKAKTKDEVKTFFIDGNSDKINSVMSEVRLTNAPFTYSLPTKKDIKSGSHYVDFYMTYFNGREWVVTKERVEFKIRNFFERNNKLISWLAIIASVFAIIRLALVPFAQSIYELFK
ncbi:UNVERIFIED_ORG: hypothetical protein J3D59_002345 [Pseudomonas fluorescens]